MEKELKQQRRTVVKKKTATKKKDPPTFKSNEEPHGKFTGHRGREDWKRL